MLASPVMAIQSVAHHFIALIGDKFVAPIPTPRLKTTLAVNVDRHGHRSKDGTLKSRMVDLTTREP